MNRVADCGKSVAARMVLACALTGTCVPTAMAQTICAPQIQWQQSFGTIGWEEPYVVQQTADGGYIIGGTWAQWGAGTGNITSTHQGDADFLIIRLDAQGQKLWDRSFGGASSDFLYALQQTADGGFIVGGLTWSGIGGNKTTSTFGSADLWVLRTDASGNKLWDQTFGGSSFDALRSLQQIADGGFILGGYSQSRPGGNKTSPYFGNDDFWVIRLDANGNKVWDRSYGGLETDVLMSLRQTADGGFILVGPSYSGQSETKTGQHYGLSDFWVLRIDSNGNPLWDKTFGGQSTDWATAVLEISGGGFLVGGYSLSSSIGGNKTSHNFGESDYWLLRLDANGDALWDRSFGGERSDEPDSLAATSDGGCVLAGFSSSPVGGTKQSDGGGYGDAWLVRVDPNGNQVWDQSFGGSGFDIAHSVQQTRDGGFVAVALSYSTDGDRAGAGFGDADFWTIKLTPENLRDCDNDGVPNELDLCPETPLGKIVDSTGCAIDQICPCNDFDAHSRYVTCVKHAAGDFQRAGLISGEQRQEIIAQAVAANCPPGFDREPIIIFGLEHIPIDGGLLSYDIEYVSVAPPVPQSMDPYGVSVLLGEADSGIFFGVGAPVEGVSDPDWYLETRAYGTFKGGPDGLISIARGMKPGDYQFPVQVDLSPLNPVSVTIQYICNDVVQDELTIPGPIGHFGVNSYYYLAPRFNPFWRMPDGSVGALLELDQGGPCSDESGYPYDRIFVRANQPERDVGHVSRVEARAGGGLPSFSFWDEWLGVFKLPHRSLGQVLLTAINDRLTVTALNPSPDGFSGVMIGARKAEYLEVDFLPVDLSAENAALDLFCVGLIDYDFEPVSLTQELFVSSTIENSNGLLRITADFLYVSADQRTEVTALRNGVVTGHLTVSNSAIAGALAYKNDKIPRITSCTFGSGAEVSLGLGLDHISTFTASDGTRLEGNHFRFAPVTPFQGVNALSQVSLQTRDLPSLTITDERSAPFAPRMEIASDAQQVLLSWRDNTRLFAVESAASLAGPFTIVTNDVEFADDQNTLSVPVQTSGPRFFRLRR
jgi:hypothetical protein